MVQYHGCQVVSLVSVSWYLWDSDEGTTGLHKFDTSCM